MKKIMKNLKKRSKISFNLPSLKLRQARQVLGRCLLLSLCRSIRTSARGSLLLIFLSIAPISAGIYCIDNEEHSLECPCNCDVIKGRHCIDCMHLQDARPLTIIKHNNKVVTQRSDVYTPEDAHMTLKKLAVRYLQNK
ncbi:MAG TPA: hypothetical protein VHX42_01440 [Candidatus Babeliales bacterium]|nr:hypothetical protein [Candidatus Babeliales bacterium]